MNHTPEVIIANHLAPQPEAHEIAVARILARHYSCIIEFLQPSAGYKMKTPDIIMNGLLWEIKSPTGSSKRSTIAAQFKGLKQSRNLIIDGRRTKLSDVLIEKQIAFEVSKHMRVGKVLLITKQLLVIEFET